MGKVTLVPAQGKQPGQTNHVLIGRHLALGLHPGQFALGILYIQRSAQPLTKRLFAQPDTSSA